MENNMIKFLPDIDWSSKADLEELFLENPDQAFLADPHMIGKKLDNLQVGIETFQKVKNDKRFSQASLRNNLGQLPPNRFNELKSGRGDELVEPTLAIMMRIYDKYPNLCPSFPFIDIPILMEEGQFSSKRELSLLLGRDQVSASRYMPSENNISKKKVPSATTMMLTYVMYLFIKAGKMDEYRDIVKEEAHYRGSKNFFSDGWPKDDRSLHSLVRRVNTRAKSLEKTLKTNGTDIEKNRIEDILNICSAFMNIVHELRAKDVSLNDCSIGLEAFKQNRVMTEKLNLDLKELKSEISALKLRESKLDKELLIIAEEIKA
jgi:hypothetical protein